MAEAGIENGNDEAVASKPKGLKPENNFPEHYIILGIGVGLFLVLLGTGILLFGKNQVASSLTICVGFGLVLAAFGAKIAGSWAGWSVTGAGAMTVLLFIVLQQYTPVDEPELMKGEIGGDFSRVAEIRIIDEEPMYIYRDTQVRRIKFLGVGKSLKSTRIRMQVDTTEKEAGKEFFELTGDTETIRGAFSQGKPVQWKFDYKARQVKDGSVVILSELDGIDPVRSADLDIPRAGIPVVGNWWSLNAFAQEPLPGGDPDRIRAALEGLRAEDTYVRRNSRDLLASAGESAVPILMAALRGSEEDYRIKLGVIYALAEMLRSDPKQAPAISAQLQAEDFPFLVRAAADQDRTIRYQAAEFLYMLQDRRAVQPSIDAAKEATDEGVANNQILILRQSGSYLPSSQKDDIVRQLNDPSGNLNKTFKDPSSLNRILKW
ncbi:HEAT repeat protein [Neorhizobium galegae]|uniref:HEAT repeat domain-containing protein n=1 Tax=Neorhizobium galegae TaxID=399 RepID=UPI002780AD94|nr:HEAT repeat domain-containing protein [Neorhizobium galegae]MDQ0133530.1 HEAT repeat protein [Neorhizobium galegae]